MVFRDIRGMSKLVLSPCVGLGRTEIGSIPFTIKNEIITGYHSMQCLTFVFGVTLVLIDNIQSINRLQRGFSNRNLLQQYINIYIALELVAYHKKPARVKVRLSMWYDKIFLKSTRQFTLIANGSVQSLTKYANQDKRMVHEISFMLLLHYFQIL